MRQGMTNFDRDELLRRISTAGRVLKVHDLMDSDLNHLAHAFEAAVEAQGMNPANMAMKHKGSARSSQTILRSV